jgi:hypothetical protein
MAEARRWRDLQWLQRGGVIRGLQRQVKFLLLPGVYDEKHKLILREASYIADFVYYENGQLVVEDVKGYRKGEAYQLFKLKQKVMYDKYKILVREVSR